MISASHLKPSQGTVEHIFFTENKCTTISHSKTKPNVYQSVLCSPSLWPPTIIFFFTFWFISGISYSWNHNLFVTGISLGTVLPSFAHVCSTCRRFSSLWVSVSSAPVAHSCLSACLSVIVPPLGYYEWCLLRVWCTHILSVCLVQSFKTYTPWGGFYGSQQCYF